MKNLIVKLSLLSVLLSSLIIAPALAATPIDCTSPSSTKDQIQCGACEANGTISNCTPAGASGTLNDTITAIINLLSLAAGIAAVIMIIVGGFRYVTSAGNPEGTKGARNTIVYALIGLLIIALAQAIVRFVLQRST
jgi:hypothetical protein